MNVHISSSPLNDAEISTEKVGAVLVNVRGVIPNPRYQAEFATANGLDTRVQDWVLNQTGGKGRALLHALRVMVRAGAITEITFADVSGVYRAPALVELMARQLRKEGHTVATSHTTNLATPAPPAPDLSF